MNAIDKKRKSVNLKKTISKPFLKEIKIGTEYQFYWWLTPVAIPIMAAHEIYDRYEKWVKSKLEWSDEKASEILDTCIHKIAEYSKEEDALYFYQGLSLNMNKIPFRHRAFCRKYYGKFLDYLTNTYVPKGCIREFEKDDYYWEDSMIIYKKA